MADTQSNRQSEPIDLLVTAAALITGDERGTVFQPGALAVADGRLVAVGAPTAVEAALGGAPVRERIESPQRLIFPGLVNTHVHLYQSLLKGFGHTLPLAEWNNRVIAPAASHLTAEDAYQAARAGCLEAIRCGTTTLLDFMHNHPIAGLSDAVIAGAREVGIRFRYGRGYRDLARHNAFAAKLTEPVERSLADVEELLGRYPTKPDGLLGIWLAPAGVRTGVSKAGLQLTREFARQRGLRVTMHVHETPADDRLTLQEYGCRTVDLLDEVGLLGPDCLAVHMVWPSQDDIDRLAARAVPVSHCPVSNMILANGVSPVLELWRAGVVVGLGTDGAASNNSLDLLETMKVAALLQKVSSGNADAVTAEQALAAATRDGARALGLADEIGSLEPGKRADFFLYNPLTVRSAASHDPIATLVYSGGAEGVESVVVNGRFVLREGQFVGIDELAALRALQQSARTLVSRAGLV